MNWMGNYFVGERTVAVQVEDVVDWMNGKNTYLAVASSVLDTVPSVRQDYPADGGIVHVGDLVLRAYKHGDVGVVYYTDRRTSRNGLFVVDCSFRAVIFPHGVRVIEMVSGDGYI